MIQNELFSEWQRKSIVINGQRTRVYDIRTITREQFRLLIACGNDSHVIPLFHALKGNWTEGISHAYIDIFD